MELRDYWLTIRRRWMVVIATLVATVSGAFLLTIQATPQYASSALIFVSATAGDDPGAAYTGNLFATQRVTSIVDFVTTRDLSEVVASNLGGDVAAAEARRSISASVNPETSNIVLTAVNPDPVLARDIAQGYAEALSDLAISSSIPDNKTESSVTARIIDNAVVSNAPDQSEARCATSGWESCSACCSGSGSRSCESCLDTSISSSEDVSAVTSAPILGHVNTDPVAVEKDPAVALAESTPWAEAFRVLRTNMQFVEVDHDHRVFVVSSSLPGEGKSTTVTSLAITLAMAGQRVALVDCDLRRPMVADRLGLDGSVGTTSVLIGQVAYEDAMQTYGDTGLDVMACGPRPPNPSELLQSQSMEKLIVNLRETYDIVLLDAPPLLPVTDGALLAAQSDGILAVVRHGKTSRDQLAHSLERIEQVDSKCVGVVINMAPAKKGGRSYGYGYGYQYQYEYSALDERATNVKRLEAPIPVGLRPEAALGVDTGASPSD